MATSTLKLRTNVPLTGFVKYANYWKGKPWADPEKGGAIKQLPDQIQLKGSWDGSTDEGLFLPISLLGTMFDMGLLRQETVNDERGNPKYTVMNGARKVRVLKSEDGKKKPIYISWADAPPPEQQAAAPAAASPAAAPQPAISPPPAKKAAPPAIGNGEQEKLRKEHRRRLKVIGETQANTWRLAKAAIDELLGEWSIERTKIPTHVYLDLIARFAATSSIEAFRQQLVVEHKKKDVPAAAPGAPAQAGSTQGAGALKPITGDPTYPSSEPPVPTPTELRADDAGPVDNADFWPEEEDELPF
jgi:hypothetical protein